MASQNFKNFEKDDDLNKIFIFRENLKIPKKIQETQKTNEGRRGTLRVHRAENWLTVYRTLANTETIAKPGRLGPAQNGKPMRKFVELSRFCSMTR